MATPQQTYDVGGVRLERPFRVLRLGHFGFNVEDQEKALHFYSDLLGLPQTDTVDFGKQFKVTSPSGQDPNGYFLRVGADHHSVVLFPRWTFAASGQPKRDGTAWISHMAWQVATLREVTEGRRWLTEQQVHIARPGGRDQRGANWNFTVTDRRFHFQRDLLRHGPDRLGRRVQAGADLPDRRSAAGSRRRGRSPISRWRAARSRPGSICARACTSAPSASRNTTSPASCCRARSASSATGRSASSPAMWTRAARFYADTMGLTLTEEISWRGHRCRLPARQYRAPHDRALSAGAAGGAGAAAGFDLHGLRHAGRQLSPAQGRGRVPRGERRHDQILAAGTIPGHRLLGLRARPRRARDPALLLHGADRLGRAAAAGVAARRRVDNAHWPDRSTRSPTPIAARCSRGRSARTSSAPMPRCSRG